MNRHTIAAIAYLAIILFFAFEGFVIGEGIKAGIGNITNALNVERKLP